MATTLSAAAVEPQEERDVDGRITTTNITTTTTTDGDEEFRIVKLIEEQRSSRDRFVAVTNFSLTLPPSTQMKTLKAKQTDTVVFLCTQTEDGRSLGVVDGVEELFQGALEANLKLLYFPVQQRQQQQQKETKKEGELEALLEVLHVQSQELSECYALGENLVLMSPKWDSEQRTLLAGCLLLQIGAAFSTDHALDLMKEARITTNDKTTFWKTLHHFQNAFSKLPEHSGKLQRWLSALPLVNDLPYGNQLLEQLYEYSKASTIGQYQVTESTSSSSSSPLVPRLLDVYQNSNNKTTNSNKNGEETKSLVLRLFKRLAVVPGGIRTRFTELGLLRFLVESTLLESKEMDNEKKKEEGFEVKENSSVFVIEEKLSCLGHVLSGDTTGLADKLVSLPGSLGKDFLLSLVKWMGEGPTRLKVPSAGLFWVLAAAGKSLQEELRVAGALPVVVAALSSSSLDLAFQAAGCLRNLIYRNPTILAAFIELGVVSQMFKKVTLLCEYFASNPASSFDEVSASTSIATSTSSSSSIRYQVGPGVLLGALLETLAGISYAPDNNGCEGILESGGLVTLARILSMEPFPSLSSPSSLSSSSSSSAQPIVSRYERSKAAVLVRGFCCNNIKCQKAFIEAASSSGFNALVHLFLEVSCSSKDEKETEENIKLYEETCAFQGALWALVKSNPETVSLLRNTPVLSTCVNSLLRCLKSPSSKRIWERCNLLGILANLTFGNQSNQDQVRSIPGGLEAVVKHLDRLEYTEETLLQNAASAAHALCIDNSENLKVFLGEGAAVLLASLVSNSRQQEVLLHHSLTVLAMLSELDPKVLLLMEGTGCGVSVLLERMDYEATIRLSSPSAVVGPVLISCAKCLRLFAQHQKEKLKTFLLKEESMTIITGAMKHLDETLLVELLMLTCLLAEDDWEMQREFRKAGGITRLVNFLAANNNQPLIVKELANKAVEVTTKGNKYNQTFMIQKKNEARLLFLTTQGQGNLESVRGLPQVLSQLSTKGGASEVPSATGPSDPFAVVR